MKGRGSSEEGARDLLTSFEKITLCPKHFAAGPSVGRSITSLQYTAATAILPGEQCIDDCPEMQFVLDSPNLDAEH
jgi:hypothetical protein